MEFVPAPDWYYNFEYREELDRGYDGYEDLMTTGYFETQLEKGESIIFSASLDEMGSPRTTPEMYEASIARRTHKIDFYSCMQHSARQFLIRRPGNRTEVIAGYPWYGVSGREELIALPGITLEQDHKEDCIVALARAPLWFFWTLQQLERSMGAEALWQRYATAMKEVLEAYRRGIGDRVRMQDDGLVRAWSDRTPLTWMNAMSDGRPANPRNGYQVEVNALWYNAVCYTLELARRFGDNDFVQAWEELPERIRRAFVALFAANRLSPAASTTRCSTRCSSST